MFCRVGERYCVAMLTHELLTAATSPGPSHYRLSMKKEPANHSATVIRLAHLHCNYQKCKGLHTHTQALNLKTICMDLLTRIWVCIGTVHNKYKCYVFILWHNAYTYTCSRHLAKDALLSNQYLPVMSVSEMGSLNTHTHTHMPLTAHTHTKQHTLHHPSLDYSLIDTHQHRIKELHTDGGGGGDDDQHLITCPVDLHCF